MRLTERVRADIARNRERIRGLGPGLITGGAGDDPAGIVTYTLVGATTGFTLLWALLLSTPMMIAIQSSVARIAIVTGKSLPEITTAFYGKKVTLLMITVLALANILTIAADLEALAVIFEIISGYRAIYFLIPITALIGYLVTFGQYRTVKKVLISLTVVLAVYIVSAIMAKPDLIQLIKSTFIPTLSFDAAWIVAALGMLGTTISPYLLFWQAAEEKEEKKSIVQADEVGFDTVVGMVYSNLLAYAMIVSGAVMLYGHADKIQEISQLALALKPAAGAYAFALFSIGIVVSGLLAIPVLAGSTAYAVSDAFGWREGMDYKVSDAKGFYIVFIGALILGDLINISPISVTDALYYSQVLDGVLLPILIVIIMLLANNPAIMGEYRNTRFNNIFSILAFVVTVALSAVMFYQVLKG